MPIVMPTEDNTRGVICGIDPGSMHCGLSALTVAWTTWTVCGLEAQTYTPPIHLGLREVDEPLDRYARISYLQERLIAAFHHYRPALIYCESPFYNRLRPGAYAVLVECVYSVRLAAAQYDPSVRFGVYEPSVVKKTVGATAHGTKIAVKDALFLIDDLKPWLGDAYSCTLDEHSLDAIAVAYTHVMKMRHQLMMPNTAYSTT
ncbi:MAG: hypothetical protein ACR2HF_12300 [Methylococcaceae bacterium]